MLPALLTLLTDYGPLAYTAGSVAATGIVGWLVWRVGWIQPWLALFVRVDPGRAGDHLSRATLLDEFQKQRVVSTDELRDRLGMNRGTLLWHLRLLERLEIVRSRRVGRVRVWYRRDAGAPSQEELLVEDAPQRRSVLEAISNQPGLTLSDVARATGLAKSSVHRHVATLAAAGIVELRKETLRTCLYRTSN